MNQQELEAKIKEVFSDEAYVKELLELDTAEEAQASLSAKGIELSVDDLLKIREMILRQADGELTDEDLESINGGCGMVATVLLIIGCFAGMAGVGIGAGAMMESYRRRRW